MRNPYGIFATSIASRFNHGTARLRTLVTSDEQAERIVAAAILTVSLRTGEDASVIEADIREGAERCYVRTRPAVKLAWSALAAVEHAYTTRHFIQGAGEGFESNAPIHDCREAGEIAESLLLVAGP